MTSALDCDVLVAGGGPAGLAVAIAARMNGLSAIVIERHPSPPDKACGECLMPPAVSALNRLGVLDLIDPDRRASIDGIRFKQEGAASAEARLPSPGGLGVRRTELTAAMMHRARGLGAEIHQRTNVRGYRIQQDQVLAETDGGPVRARFLAAADGLHSRLRSMAGLQATSSGPRRFGLRQHFRVKPWSRFVEVHFTDGVEAYVTPVGPMRVGVTFLWDDARVARQCISIDRLFERFPSVSARLAGAVIDSRPRGAGPMARTARSRIADRFALVGDAAGYRCNNWRRAVTRARLSAHSWQDTSYRARIRWVARDSPRVPARIRSPVPPLRVCDKDHARLCAPSSASRASNRNARATPSNVLSDTPLRCRLALGKRAAREHPITEPCGIARLNPI